MKDADGRVTQDLEDVDWGVTRLYEMLGRSEGLFS